MRLAAIYIQEHEFLFDKPQVVNFGGEFIYNFEHNEFGVIEIHRNENPNFIKDLFSISDSKINITCLTAIVGANGSGKTSLLNLLRSQISAESNAFPFSTSLLVYESEDSELPLIAGDGVEYEFRIEKEKVKLKSGSRINRNRQKIKTIYYSPHLDLRYSPRFSTPDSHDISLDTYLETDLSKYSDFQKGIMTEYPSNYQRELLFRRSLRQINFLSSTEIPNREILEPFETNITHGEVVLQVRHHQRSGDQFWNLPNAFRNAFEMVDAKVEKESREWYKERDRLKLDQIDINRYMLKRELLLAINHVIFNKAELENAFLSEGIFLFEKFEKEQGRLDAKDTLLLFLKLCRLPSHNGKTTAAFDTESLKELIEIIYRAVDQSSAVSEKELDRYSILVESSVAIRVLNFQRDFLNDLAKYYYKSSSDKEQLNDRDRVDEFIAYFPSVKRLSSGENSLLAFYSNLYDFLKSNFVDGNYLEPSNHYILLIDEGDLGFHPKWKMKYIYSILTSLPYFFECLETKPSIQIVLTTHDAIALSDIPSSNIVYVNSEGIKVSGIVKGSGQSNSYLRTFGANVTEILADSFFLDGPLIGAFARSKIEEVVSWLNNLENKEEAEKYLKLINMIDEPIVQRKLIEMYDAKMSSNEQRWVIDKQIRFLESLRKKQI